MSNKLRQIIEAPSQLLQDPFNLFTWLSSFWRKLGQVEEWHEVGTSGEPAFENSWVNYALGHATAAFYKDPWGIVHIKGLVKSGTIGTAIFTLPTGYIPALHLNYGSVSNNLFYRLEINSGGGVVFVNGSNAWGSINCSFRVEP